jgi:hypothetical protein
MVEAFQEDMIKSLEEIQANTFKQNALKREVNKYKEMQEK